ncbi:transcriptional regulator [Nocardia transvalensis]|uniref:transcriptional regulator n=1 Tax=Nocardia transvalensis TaxID=37333 RepID=UPI001895E9EC|nr:transcriptional regulator [Nocardia transvalensis]MBF6328470.1 transcriptional regulator [Nocardia transvalensis]
MSEGKQPATGEARQEITFAQKLNKLLEVLAREDGRAMSAARFLEDFTAKTGMKLSAGYLSELRNGRVTAPRMDLIEALASYFRVNPAYFFPGPTDEENQARLDLLASMRDNQAQNLAIRASGLSAPTLRRLATIIESARVLENLPATPGGEEFGEPS